MVEVFKTNVSNIHDASFLVERIHHKFKGSRANFDLEDCDLILRIHMETEFFPIAQVIAMLNEYGFQAEVLADNVEYVWSQLRR